MYQSSSTFLAKIFPYPTNIVQIIAGFEQITNNKLQDLNKYTRKTCGCGQLGGHLIRVLKERSVIDGGNLCPLWLVILKSV